MRLSRKNKFIGVLLWPFSLLYGIAVAVRNFCFDAAILRTKVFDMPVISVGNLTVGGTGKTPHTEYLVRLLQRNGYRVATLSRGYGRKTKGFLLADENMSSREVGDEPCQMKRKFPDVTVAVDENRCEGVERLMELQPQMETVLLDDAYQHRYIKPGLSMLLVDYNRPIADDSLLPKGDLREPAENIGRADVVVVTKCPSALLAMDALVMKKSMKLHMRQEVFFSTLRYDENMCGLTDGRSVDTVEMLWGKRVLLLAGIASPQPMCEYVGNYASEVRLLAFPDHHEFNEADLQLLCDTFAAFGADDSIIVTTEKDAVRLRGASLPSDMADKIYVLGVKVAFLFDKEDSFNRKILNYVEENRRGR